MATRVATSTESVSLPKRNGPWTLHEGRVGDSKSSCCLNANLDRASEDISSKLWMGSMEMELRTCFRWLLRIFPSLSGNGRNGSPTGAYQNQWPMKIKLDISSIPVITFQEIKSWKISAKEWFSGNTGLKNTSDSSNESWRIVCLIDQGSFDVWFGSIADTYQVSIKSFQNLFIDTPSMIFFWRVMTGIGLLIDRYAFLFIKSLQFFEFHASKGYGHNKGLSCPVCIILLKCILRLT